jgi:hypothetical protein
LLVAYLGLVPASTTPTNYNYHYLGIRRHVPHEETAGQQQIISKTTASHKNASSAYGKVSDLNLTTQN